MKKIDRQGFATLLSPPNGRFQRSRERWARLGMVSPDAGEAPAQSTLGRRMRKEVHAKKSSCRCNVRSLPSISEQQWPDRNIESLQADQDEESGEIKPAERRNDAADRAEHRFAETAEQRDGGAVRAREL